MIRIFTQGKAYLHRMLSYAVVCTLLLAASAALAQPTFSGGRYQSTHVCDNAGYQNLASLLSVNDPSSGTALTWTVINTPIASTDGSVSGTSTGTTTSPSSFIYIIPPGVTSDLVSVVVSDGVHTDTTDITVNITPLMAVVISPTFATFCPGEPTEVTIVGPPGALITYQYEIQDYAGLGGPFFDTTYNTVLDSSGHSVIPVPNPDLHSGETGNISQVETNRYYTLLSGSVGGCSASYDPSSQAWLVARYVYGEWESDSATYILDPTSTDRHVCAGSSHTVTLHTAPNATAVIKFTDLSTLATSYDTVVVPSSGLYNIPTGPITGPISYTVLYINNAGCDRMIMGDYTIRLFPITPATLTSETITGSAYPDYIEETYPAGPYAATCTGTFRNLRLEFDGTTIVTGPDLPMPRFVTYTINGGLPQIAPIGDYDPITAIINTGTITTDQSYHFIGINDDAGCYTPISDSFFIPILEYPSATFSVTPSVCAGDSVTLTVSGTPTQLFFMYANGVGSLHQVDSSGVFTLSSGSLDTSIEYVLESGYYEHEGNCLTHYDDTASVVVTHAPIGTVISSASSSICIGSSISLSASISGGSWSVSGGHTSVSGGVLTGISSGTDTLTYIVSNSCGTDTATQIVAVTPATVVTATMSGADSICQGATTLFSVTAPAGGIWSAANSAIATVDAGGHVYGVAGGITTISYTVPFACGSSVATHTIAVRALPAPVTISGSDTVCVGSTTTISTTSTEGHWDIGLPSIATIDAGGHLTGVSPGTTPVIYRVDVVGCGMAADTLFVTVLPSPSAGVITVPDSICIGGSVTCTSTIAGGTWTSSNVIVAVINPTSGSVYAMAVGNTVISYSVTSTGCGSATATHVVRVNAVPSVAAITGTMMVCEGDTTSLHCVTAAGTWSSGSTAVASVDASGVVYGLAAGVAPITYSVTNVSGCEAHQIANVTVNPLPVLSPISGPAAVAVLGTATMLDTATGGTWACSDPLLATIDPATGVVSGVAMGMVTISYAKTNSFGCSALVTRDLVVAGSLSSTEMLYTGAIALCNGNPVTLGTVTDTGTTDLSFQWLVDGVAISGATATSYVATVPGYYGVIISNLAGTDTVYGVTVLPPLNATIGLAGTNTLYTGSFSTYQWYLNGVAIGGANTSIYNATVSGNYQVVVADTGGCTDTSDIYIFTAVGVGDVHTASPAIALYPNPANSVLYIDAPFAVNVKLTTADGRTLITTAGTKAIDVSQLAAGMYMVMVYDKNGVLLKTEKLIKAE